MMQGWADDLDKIKRGAKAFPFQPEQNPGQPIDAYAD